MKYSSEDYELMNETAINLRMDYGFLKEKMDVFELAKKLNITLIPYSYLNSKQIKKVKEFDELLKDGFTIIRQVNGKNEFYTFFDDSVNTYRQRFTIAHEIKHVVFCEKEPTQKEEDLANYFARCLLAPSFLVMKYIGSSPFSIAYLFDISFEAAQYALEGALSRVAYGHNQLTSLEEEYSKMME